MITLKNEYPSIYKRLDYKKNTQEYPHIKLDEIAPHSNILLYWNCLQCHNSEKGSPGNMIKRKGPCEYCTGKKLLKGYNDFLTKSPELAKLQSINDTNDLSEITYNNSRTIIEFKCLNNHVFKSTPRDLIITKTMCKICGNRELLSGFNDIKTTFPNLLDYWEWTRENKNTPETTLTLTHQKLYLKCPRGHEETKTVSTLQRNDRLSSCTQCSLYSLDIIGSLNETHPEISKSYSSKNNIPIHQVSYKYSKKLTWECSEKHEWEEICSKRIIKGTTACPYCYPKLNNKEKEVLQFINKILNENNHKTLIKTHERSLLKNSEVDFYLENLNKAIEFNGCFWHTDKMCLKNRGMTALEYHSKKQESYSTIGIDLVYIWECDFNNKKEELEEALIHWLKTGRKSDILIRLQENHLDKYEQ